MKTMTTQNSVQRADAPSAQRPGDELTRPFLLIADVAATSGEPAQAAVWAVDPSLHLLNAAADRISPAATPDPALAPHTTSDTVTKRTVGGDTAAGDTPRGQQSLEPRLMKLLCLLAADAGQVVGRQQLIDALWPRVVVNDNSLNRAVSDLRKALQTSDGHIWIQTIPKRGYRLCAHVQTLHGSAAGTTGAGAPANAAAPRTSTVKITARPEKPALPTSGGRLAQWRRWTPTAAAAVLLALSVLTQQAQPPNHTPAPLATLTPDRVVPGDSVLQGANGAAVVNSRYLQPGSRDRVLTDNSALNLEGRFQLLVEDNLPVADVPPAILVASHQLMAYVDRHDGISQLKLRHAFADDTPWVAFTTDEQIQHLQWSPLDDGLLFTVGQDARESGAPTYVRLMLLEMDTLSLHELYRREIAPNLEPASGKLT